LRLDPPSRHTLLLSHLDASLEVAGLVVAGTNFWGSGKVEPTGFKLLRSLRLSRFHLDLVSGQLAAKPTTGDALWIREA